MQGTMSELSDTEHNETFQLRAVAPRAGEKHPCSQRADHACSMHFPLPQSRVANTRASEAENEGSRTQET
jgi:hypothetical protein